MKNLFVIIQALLFILIISACSGPKKTAERPDAKETNTAPKTTDAASPPADVKPAVKNANAKSIDKTMTGSQILDNALNSLNKRLVFNEIQLSGVKDILKNTFKGMGEDLDRSYNSEQSKTIKQDLLQKSSDQIMGLLDEQQKQKFKSMQHP